MIPTVLAELVTSHQERAVIRVADVFVKVDTDPDRLRREVAALAAAPVPTPVVLWHRPGLPQLLALSLVDGMQLAVLGEPSRRPRSAWHVAGDIARRIHDSTIPAGLDVMSRYRLEDLAALEEWLLSRNVGDRGLVAEHARRARTAASEAADNTFVHGDLQPAHIFLREDGTVSGVIDWADAGVGDPHYDLAVLTVGHSEHLEPVLEGYDRPVDRDLIRGFWSWRRLGSVRWMIEHGFDPTGDINALRHTD